MNRSRLLLTPAAAVVALAAVAVIAAGVPRGLNIMRSWGERPKTAAASAPATPSPQPVYTVAGTIRLHAGEYQTTGGTCRGARVGEGDQVIVTNANGAALSYAEIRAGQPTATTCELPFTLTIPAGEGRYGVDVPQWGMSTYSERDLAETLTLAFG